jgi:hypothetical protein
MYTPVKLDKIRNFRYGMKALSQIEKLLKTPISKLDFDNLTQEELATIICCGLLHEDKSLTPEIVMDLIDDHSSVVEISKVLGEAFTASFGSAVEKTAANEGK